MLDITTVLAYGMPAGHVGELRVQQSRASWTFWEEREEKRRELGAAQASNPWEHINEMHADEVGWAYILGAKAMVAEQNQSVLNARYRLVTDCPRSGGIQTTKRYDTDSGGIR